MTKTKAKPKAWTPRATTYRGIRMRSRLEAAWAEQFDAVRLEWEYEPRCFASEEGQYLPDFLLPGPWVYVEVKPWQWLGVDDASCAWSDREAQRLLRILKASDEDARLWVCTSADEDGNAAVVEVNQIHGEEASIDSVFTFVDFSDEKPVKSLYAKKFDI